MIQLTDVLLLHQKSIDKYGGSHGIRDEGMLLSAIARPYQSFANEDLYPTVFEKSAAIIESIVINHPFVDGNKRTGFLCMFYILDENHYQITASQEDAYQFVIAISTGQKRFEEIVEWLQGNTKSMND